MNLGAVRAEVGRRLLPIVEVVYDHPSNAPMFPSAIVSYPSLITYHVDLSYQIARLDVDVTLWIPRSNAESGMADLDDYLSSVGAKSVSKALEAKPIPEAVWHRCAVLTASNFRAEGDAIGVTFAIQIDA